MKLESAPEAPSNRDYDVAGLAALYAAERDHFWFIHRRNAIVALAHQYLSEHAEFLEIGAGTGSVSRALMDAGFQMTVAEQHAQGVDYARSYGLERCYQADLYHHDWHEEFDAAGLFDVIEHLDDDVGALRSVAKALRPGGTVFLSVPAHAWLWSREDEIASHKRRYTRASLEQTIHAAGLGVAICRPIFQLILPLLLLRRALSPARNEPTTAAELERTIYLAPPINAALKLICALEKKIEPMLPNALGGSLLAVARKPASSAPDETTDRGTDKT